jgi:capsular exopolysaccharide synthesis family protein
MGINKNRKDETQMVEVFRKVLYHWPLYLIMFFVSVVAASLYLRYSKAVFSTSARIYIKDEKKSGNSQLNALEQLSVLGGNKLVENEMEVIKSPILLEDVIRENKFNIRYFTVGRLVQKEVYKTPPIKVQVLTDDAEVGNYNFSVKIKKSGTAQINYGPDGDENYVVKTNLNEPFTVGKDRFILTYYPDYNITHTNNFKVTIDSIRQLAYVKAAELNTALLNKQSSVFEMTYQDGIPERAADFLNAIARKYNQYTLNDKNQTVVNTINFINARLDSLGGELNVLERDVERFKTTRGITEIQETSKLFLEQAKNADLKLDEAKIQLSVYDQIERSLNNSTSSAPFTPLLGNVDPALTSLITNYEGQINERKKLSLSLQPSNPIVQNLDQQIAESRNTIKNYIAGYRRNAVTAKTGLEGKVNEIEGMIAKVPMYERQFIGIKRQQSVKEALYLFLLQKKEESAVSYASTISDNKLISPAFIPTRPVFPKKPIIYMAFVIGGIVITTAYLYLKYMLNAKLVSKKDIEKIFEFPVVAEIFKEEKKHNQKIFDKDSRSRLNEQVLNLKSNLKFMLSQTAKSPVILFTSSVSGEGKSFLSAQLGNALSNNQCKVVMLELDLRKPKLAQYLGLGNQVGFTNYILGANTIDEIVKKVPESDNLYIIPSGPIPPNPVELIESKKMEELLTRLRERFDYILIDTAPVGLVSDAKNLFPLIDATLFVIKFNYTPQAKLVEVAESLEGLNLKNVGIIFNAIDADGSYGYYSYGYSNYGYGYGNIKGKFQLMPSFSRIARRLY